MGLQTASILALSILTATAESPSSPPVTISLPSFDELMSRSWGFRFKPYGFLVANAVYNAGTGLPTLESPSFAARGSRSPASDGLEGIPWDHRGTVERPGSFLISARQSRLGFELGIPMSEDFNAGGRMEIDFAGLWPESGPPGITMVAPRLRLAYFELQWRSLTIRGGQDWQLLSPSPPLTVANLAIAGYTGAGYLLMRTPQLSVAHRVKLDFLPSEPGRAALVFRAAVMRNWGGDHEGTGISPFETADPGAYSQLPAVQARADFEHPWLNVGVAGHAAQEAFRITAPDGTFARFRTIPSWALSTDASVKFAGLVLAGQLFTGANINQMGSLGGARKDPYLNAMDKPVPGTLRSVQALHVAGGWVQLQLPVIKDHLTAVTGVGLETQLRSDLAPAAERSFSGISQVEVILAVNKHLDGSLAWFHYHARYGNFAHNDRGDLDHFVWSSRVKF